MKRCPTLLGLREMQIKTNKQHLTTHPTELQKLKRKTTASVGEDVDNWKFPSPCW
jgi:hypothetical protein